MNLGPALFWVPILAFDRLTHPAASSPDPRVATACGPPDVALVELGDLQGDPIDMAHGDEPHGDEDHAEDAPHDEDPEPGPTTGPEGDENPVEPGNGPTAAGPDGITPPPHEGTGEHGVPLPVAPEPGEGTEPLGDLSPGAPKERERRPRDPGEEAKLVTFTELASFDYYLGDGGVESDLDDIPERIWDLDNRLVTIEGYMVPLDYEGELVTSFLLSRVMVSCCFAILPQPTELIEVTIVEGDKKTEAILYGQTRYPLPVRAGGKAWGVDLRKKRFKMPFTILASAKTAFSHASEKYGP